MPAEARAVADAGRHGNHRHGDQARDHPRQRALHAGDHDDTRSGRRAVRAARAAGAGRPRRRR